VLVLLWLVSLSLSLLSLLSSLVIGYLCCTATADVAVVGLLSVSFYLVDYQIDQMDHHHHRGLH